MSAIDDLVNAPPAPVAPLGASVTAQQQSDLAASQGGAPQPAPAPAPAPLPAQMHPTDAADAAAFGRSILGGLNAPAAIDPTRPPTRPETKTEKRDVRDLTRDGLIPKDSPVQPKTWDDFAKLHPANPGADWYAKLGLPQGPQSMPVAPPAPPSAGQPMTLRPMSYSRGGMTFADPQLVATTKAMQAPPAPPANLTGMSDADYAKAVLAQNAGKDPSTGAPMVTMDPSKIVTAGTGANAPSADNSFRMPGMPGTPGRVIPAHNVAVVDPAFQAQERGAAAREGEHVLQAGEQQTAAGLAKGQAMGGVVDADRQAAADAARAQAEQQAKIQPLIEQHMDTARERAKMHLSNPDTRGPLRRIADALGAGLSAAGMGLLHQSGPNPVLERIHGDIDREVDRQKEEFARKGAQLDDQTNLYGQVYQMTGSAKASREAVQNMMIQAAKDHVDEVATKSNAPSARASARLMKDKIDETDLQRKIAENPRVQAAATGPSAADIHKRAVAIIDDSAKTGQALSPADAYRRAYLEATGADLGKGELPTYGKQAAGGAALDPKSVPNVAGASTAYDLTRGFQGTDAHKSLEKQGQYNSEVVAFGKTNLGLRVPADREPWEIPALAPFAVKPGDTQETINEKRRAFQAAITRHPRAAGKGGGEGEAEPEP